MEINYCFEAENKEISATIAIGSSHTECTCSRCPNPVHVEHDFEITKLRTDAGVDIKQNEPMFETVSSMVEQLTSPNKTLCEPCWEDFLKKELHP